MICYNRTTIVDRLKGGWATDSRQTDTRTTASVDVVDERGLRWDILQLCVNFVKSWDEGGVGAAVITDRGR